MLARAWCAVGLLCGLAQGSDDWPWNGAWDGRWYGQSPDTASSPGEPPGVQPLQIQPLQIQPLQGPLGPMEAPLWLPPPASASPLHPHPWQAPPEQPPVWLPPADADHAPTEGCNCPSCAAASGAPYHVHPSELPLFAQSDMQYADPSWLPEVREAWFGRPFGAGPFAGVLWGDELIASRLEMKAGLLTGIRFGGDYNNRWSWDNRIAYANPEVINLQGPQLARDADLFLAESSLVYSRYATKRLRPFVSVGAGAMYLDTTDHLGRELREFMTVIPVGAGLKYRHYDWLVFRLDVRDNIALGDQAGLDLMHNLSVAGGVEFRFGGSPNTYYPWNPSRNVW